MHPDPAEYSEGSMSTASRVVHERLVSWFAMMTMGDIGVVVIGRNEGERLLRCLASVVDRVDTVVYVDSGSVDDSVKNASAIGVDVISLDLETPFTAARARNAGFNRLLELKPTLELVQFVDGDCTVQIDWLETAGCYLRDYADVGVVAGRRREARPDASPYNKLADMEWNTPVGEADTCGGDVMMRVNAFKRVGGYRATLIAGEDPELCMRVRRAGYRVVRLDVEMTLHDAAMDRFSQWWRRTVRSGHAYAECSYLHREPNRLRRLLSIVFWGGALPALSLAAAWLTKGLSLLLVMGYGVLWWRVRDHRLRRGDSPDDAQLYAAATVVGKAAEFLGVLQFAWNRLVRRRASRLIEYKRRS